MRPFVPFTHKNANFRISAETLQVAQQCIIEQRGILETYLKSHPEFGSSLVPVVAHDHAPQIALRMAVASCMAGSVGPMAAVAGTVAQMAVEATLQAGNTDVVVENGGDIFVAGNQDLRIGLFAGSTNPFGSKLALLIKKESLPLAICSSSSHMGHSLSFGQCDLATVVSANASLADAAATQACNAVTCVENIPDVLSQISSMPGILGILLVKDDKIGIQGDHFPELIRNADEHAEEKITLDSSQSSLDRGH